MVNLQELEIIQGKGTGILQKPVREFLDENPYVTTYRFANFNAGGTGVTVAELK